MEENNPKLRVVRRDRGGRCRYDAAGKRALVEACLHPGVSVARKAQENGINANLLRKWIAGYLLERERAALNGTPAKPIPEQEIVSRPTSDAMPIAPMPRSAEIAPTAFVPIVAASPITAAASPDRPAAPPVAPALHVRLPNGVQFDLGQTNLEMLSSVVQMLGKLPCSGSTRD
jgi:transposase